MFRKINILCVVMLYLISSNVSAQASFDEINSYTPEQQLKYLKNMSPQTQAAAKSDPELFVKMLVDITASHNTASGIALYYLQYFLLQISDNSRGYQQPGYTKVLNSTYLSSKLSKIILQPDVNKKMLAGAITAHSLIYPPNKSLLMLYREIIEKADPRQGRVIANILEAHVRYQSHKEYKIPNYVYKKLPELVNHHSDSVQKEAISMLADKNGLNYLPELFAQLDSNSHGSSVNQTIIYKILSLDTSNTTIKKLEKSREKVNNTRVKKIITNSLLPDNLARQRKINGKDANK